MDKVGAIFLCHNMMERNQLDQIAEIQDTATDQQIAEAENDLEIKFPEEYRLLLSCSNGLLANDLVNLYSTDEIAERNSTFEIGKYLPGYLMIGDDCGGSGIFLDAGSNPSPVYLMGHGSLSLSDAVVLAPSLTDWINHRFPLRDS
jgi:SMI1 / KNR4 family (SUKH-1)